MTYPGLKHRSSNRSPPSMQIKWAKDFIEAEIRSSL